MRNLGGRITGGTGNFPSPGLGTGTAPPRVGLSSPGLGDRSPKCSVPDGSLGLAGWRVPGWGMARTGVAVGRKGLPRTMAHWEVLLGPARGPGPSWAVLVATATAPRRGPVSHVLRGKNKGNPGGPSALARLGPLASVQARAPPLRVGTGPFLILSGAAGLPPPPHRGPRFLGWGREAWPGPLRWGL